MKISIICVGKIKKGYMKDFIDDYCKRCSKYCKVEIIELKDEVLKDNSMQGELKLLNEEARRIEKYLQKSAFKVCLAIEGTAVSSEEFASLIDESFNESAHLQFIIGGSYGVAEEIKKQCNKLVSFSKMTFPHQMMRGVLLEQLYRSFKIKNNESYHK